MTNGLRTARPSSTDSSGPTRIRTWNRPVMHPPTTFAASFEFVGWTVPSPWLKTAGACRPVSTPSHRRGLGSGLPYRDGLGFPEFDR